MSPGPARAATRLYTRAGPTTNTLHGPRLHANLSAPPRSSLLQNAAAGRGQTERGLRGSAGAGVGLAVADRSHQCIVVAACRLTTEEKSRSRRPVHAG